MTLLDLIGAVFKPAVALVDELHTSTEEKLIQKARILDAQAAALDAVLDYEKEVFGKKADIVKAEAESEHVITAIWRPVVMLAFCGLAVGDSLGLLASPLAPEAWTLLQVGIGGYVISRGGEKIAKSVITARASQTD